MTMWQCGIYSRWNGWWLEKMEKLVEIDEKAKFQKDSGSACVKEYFKSEVNIPSNL